MESLSLLKALKNKKYHPFTLLKESSNFEKICNTIQNG